MKTIALALLLLPRASHGAAESAAEVLQEAFGDTAARAKPAVVNISVIHETRVRMQSPHFFFGDPEELFREFMEGQRPRTYRRRSQGTGSGFFVDPKGYLVTNDHVVRGASDIRVTLTRPDGKEKTYPGRVIGRDPGLDLAVVKVQAAEPFPYLGFAERPPRVGDWAVAIGSPFTLEQTVTAGIVSAIRQSLVIEGRRYPNMIQTDAAINQGNSGGPLLNLKGEVVGVNTAIFSPSGAFAGIGFAIPAGEVRRTLKYMLEGKRLRRGWMGIQASPVDEIVKRRFALPGAEGVLVNSVDPKSPAEKAGLRRGDVIRRFDGRPIASPQDLVAAAAASEAGKTVQVQVYRRGVPMDLRVTLGERPEQADLPEGEPLDGEERPPREDGEEHAAAFEWEGVEFSGREAGVVVSRVDRDSRLLGYLMPGDVIRGINEAETPDLEALRAAARKADLSEGLFLDIVRRGQPLYISMKP